MGRRITRRTAVLGLAGAAALTGLAARFALPARAAVHGSWRRLTPLQRRYIARLAR